MAKNGITIKEIAEKADVSIGTVDRVLHERGKVSEEKEKLIKKIIKQENYRPNIFARNLKLSKVYTFGVLIPERHQDSHYWELPEKGIKKAEKELSNRKVNIEYYYFDKSSNKNFENICEDIDLEELDGLLIAPVLFKASSEFIQYLPENLPYVFIDSTIPEADNISYIGQNSYDSGKLAGKLMRLLLGTESEIVVIKSLPEDYHIEQRVGGFEEYFKNRGQFEVEVTEVEEENGKGGYDRIMDQIINKKGVPEGIFIPNANSHYIAEYINENNIKSNNRETRIIGYDLVEKNKKFLESEIIDFIIDQAPKKQGYEGIFTLYKQVVLKEEPQKELIMPINIATKENMNYF